MTDLRLQVVNTEQAFTAAAQQWQQLAAQDEQASFFNDWQWNSLWWEHYQHLGQLHVLLVYSDTQLVGVGPFYRNRSKALGLGKLDTLRFLGAGGDTSPDDLNIIVDPKRRQEVTELLCDHLFGPGFGRIMLAEVPEASTFYTTFKAYAKATPGYALSPITHTRRVAELPTQWVDFRQQISRNTHKQMKRRQNRLAALGHAEFNVCCTKEQVDRAFDALVRLHFARWQSKGQTGSFDSEVYRLFHRSLMSDLLNNNQLWLITLEIDGEIMAVEYAFEYKQTLMFFQTGFNPEIEHLSPGHVLMSYAIKRAVESGVQRIDLLKGDYPYKASYANQELHSADIGFYAKGLYSFLARLNDYRLAFKRA